MVKNGQVHLALGTLKSAVSQEWIHLKFSYADDGDDDDDDDDAILVGQTDNRIFIFDY